MVIVDKYNQAFTYFPEINLIDDTVPDETTRLIEVPLENQFEGVALENGCEVTSLSMLLRYYGFQTNKNQLADELNYVPLDLANGLKGNPHDGFVGNIKEGEAAMGVGVEPLAKVAEKIVGQNYHVNVSKHSFEDLEQLVKKGKPVLVIATIDFEVPEKEDLWLWQTTSGTVQVSPLCHAAVITGIDEQFVYVNDPYGYQHRKVDKEDFQSMYQKMGEHSLYLEK
ncbi:C39 family peptidase [Enterococcus saccharolyticus]|nr:C39 family peptidase [Enterococcus saccharolyticus]